MTASPPITSSAWWRTIAAKLPRVRGRPSGRTPSGPPFGPVAKRSPPARRRCSWTRQISRSCANAHSDPPNTGGIMGNISSTVPNVSVDHQLRLAGRTAIVTGAGRGIGRAVAELYAREGARVVIASRSAEGCASAVEAIEAAGGTAIAKPTNVGIKSDVVDMVGFAVETYGSLDILVNNAQSWGTRDQPAGLPVPTPLELFDDAELDWTLHTGFRGTFWAMQAAFPHMRERGGRIINFASGYGAIGNNGTVAYNITKEAVRSLSRTAAREWGRYAITVNVVEPAAKTDAADYIERANPEAMAAAGARRSL